MPVVPVGTRALGSKADYFDSRRQCVPKTTLANDYLALKTSFQRTFGASKVLGVDNSPTDYNQLYFWEPTFTPAEFLTETFHTACQVCYSEFRVRCVKVVLHPLSDNTQGYPNALLHPCKSWIWYPENHYQLVPQTEIGSYTDMLEAGERITPCGKTVDDVLTMRAVPQTLYFGSDATSSIYKDIQSPWQATSAANYSMQYRMPFFVWRMAYSAEQGFTNRYQVTFQAIVEFRNPRANQL